MKRFALILCLALSAPAAVPAWAAAQTRDRQTRDSLGADWSPQTPDARNGVRDGRLMPLAQVVARVSQRIPGRLLDAGVEDDGAGRQVYRVRWAAASGRRLDVIVDAATGQVLREEGR